ncbi:MAG: DUF1853 family protein [Crocinitomicaceae bacterium]|nr:DUF1853 family protein [Crocinitomicaceae bacterium]
MIVNKKQYQNNVIRDLDFLLHSDFLIHSYPQISFPEGKILSDLLMKSNEVLASMDTQNEVIQKLLEARNLRLGHYCEALLESYFQHHPQIEILEHSWQIIREGITVGEIDFILKINGQVFGLETSLKYYAGFSSDLSGWKGPRRKDTFLNKLEKVASKQLPLFLADEVVEKYGDIPSHFFVKGHLFGAKDIQLDQLKKIEFDFVEWEQVASVFMPDVEYFIFPKKAWVSDIYFASNEYKCPPDQVLVEIRKYRENGKSLILGLRSKNVFQNYLVVDAEGSSTM